LHDLGVFASVVDTVAGNLVAFAVAAVVAAAAVVVVVVAAAAAAAAAVAASCAPASCAPASLAVVVVVDIVVDRNVFAPSMCMHKILQLLLNGVHNNNYTFERIINYTITRKPQLSHMM